MIVAVTGANGFIGARVVDMLEKQGRIARACVRDLHPDRSADFRYCSIGNIGADTDWSRALSGVSVVVHTAARVHVMRDTASDPLEAFREVNVRGTLNLARQAAALGVKRFIFVSSIKVNGEATPFDCPFRADDPPLPIDAYGLSKLEAERGLLEIAKQTGLEVAIVRPPLVYGAGVKGNFASLIEVVRRGVPLPLGAIQGNRRSMVSLENLVSLLIKCIDHPKAVNQIFLVCDGEDLSTAELLLRLGRAMERPVRLMYVPAVILKCGAAMLGRKNIAQRLLESLRVDDQKTREVLGWNPVLSVDQGLIIACRKAQGN
ncbi:UDP-glucose 4-epimerase family protein [Chromobacterium haemolyticum]|uniref:NAD-dependent epimerase/dehydratase domain-containing protein n=1 Tax=Chromobacterium haemolyticum TaxID=394935 RepID=A0A1W0CVM8_9NEIS|nr:SDR family oxidoreductase [Chromobacterium haemolyticum]OQS38632.1 hypothetical protein B0T45_12695 [Chromobacterium haemolyticum]